MIGGMSSISERAESLENNNKYGPQIGARVRRYASRRAEHILDRVLGAQTISSICSHHLDVVHQHQHAGHASLTNSQSE